MMPLLSSAHHTHMTTPMRVPHVNHTRSGTGTATTLAGGGGMRGVIVNHSKSKSSPSIHQTLLSTHSRAASVQQLTNSSQQRLGATSMQQHHSPNAIYLSNNNNNNIDRYVLDYIAVQFCSSLLTTLSSGIAI